MLVLSRKASESVVIGENVEVEILEIRGNVVRIGIRAPREVRVIRSELSERPVSDEQKKIKVASGQSAVKSESPSPVSETSEGNLQSFLQRRRRWRTGGIALSAPSHEALSTG